MSYTIGQAAQMCGLSTPTLRYYEKEDLLTPERTASGLRRYSDEDVQWLHFIDHMRTTGMSIADLKRYVTLRRNNTDDYQEELLGILRRHEEQLKVKLAHYQANLELVHFKIEMYEKELAERNVDLYDLYRERGCSQLEKLKETPTPSSSS